ncbi:MAG: antitoxin CptB [Candidatus Azotimanducaceae bacterium]|jgi:antitoxin CptB|tara:strand:- start:4633 stop:4941 length:309 start_codon:yes stop_codon:yes gene_type:complete
MVSDCLKASNKSNNLGSVVMSATDLKQIYWRSRRGMLEIEAKLVPFIRDCFHDLSSDEQKLYEQMLDLEDWDIFDWLQGREIPEDPMMRELVGKIIACKSTL